jgi:hypothetical protein
LTAHLTWPPRRAAESDSLLLDPFVQRPTRTVLSLSLQWRCAGYPSFCTRLLLRPRARPTLQHHSGLFSASAAAAGRHAPLRGRRRRRTTPACSARMTVGACLAGLLLLPLGPRQPPAAFPWHTAGRLGGQRGVPLPPSSATRPEGLATCSCGALRASSLIMIMRRRRSRRRGLSNTTVLDAQRPTLCGCVAGEGRVIVRVCICVFPGCLVYRSVRELD